MTSFATEPETRPKPFSISSAKLKSTTRTVPIKQRWLTLNPSYIRRVSFKSSKMTNSSAGYSQRKVPWPTLLSEWPLLCHLCGNLSQAHPNTHSQRTLSLLLLLHLLIILTSVPTKRKRRSTQNPISCSLCYQNLTSRK